MEHSEPRCEFVDVATEVVERRVEVGDELGVFRALSWCRMASGA